METASERERCAALRVSVRWHEPDAGARRSSADFRRVRALPVSVGDLRSSCALSRIPCWDGAGMRSHFRRSKPCDGVPLQRVAGAVALPRPRWQTRRSEGSVRFRSGPVGVPGAGFPLVGVGGGRTANLLGHQGPRQFDHAWNVRTEAGGGEYGRREQGWGMTLEGARRWPPRLSSSGSATVAGSARSSLAPSQATHIRGSTSARAYCRASAATTRNAVRQAAALPGTSSSSSDEPPRS